MARGGELELEPFFQTAAAEGVQAVEERERLVEHFGADLCIGSIVSACGKATQRTRCAQGLIGDFPRSLTAERKRLTSSGYGTSLCRGVGPRTLDTYRARQLLFEVEPAVGDLHGQARGGLGAARGRGGVVMVMGTMRREASSSSVVAQRRCCG